MSGIVNFDYNKIINGQKDHRIGKWCQKLSAVIEDTVNNTDGDELIKLLYNISTSDSAKESIAIEDGFGLMKATLDGNKAQVDRTNFIGKKEWEHITYKLQIQYTKQYLEDCNYALKPDQGLKARQIPEVYFRTREKSAVLGYILGENEYMDFANARTPLTTYDGKPLYSASHTYGTQDGHAYGTQSNLFYVVNPNPTAGDLAEYLSQASINIRQMKDSNGNAQNFSADTLLIPGASGNGKIEMLARQAIGSDFFPTGATNAINTQAGIWNFKVLSDWEIKNGDPFEMIVISQDAKENLMSQLYDRTGLSVSAHEDSDHDVFKWNGRARWSLGHANYRHTAKVKVFKEAPSDTSNMTLL